MFLRNLEDDERLAFLELASRAAVADGVIQQEEAEMMAVFRAECGMDEQEYPLSGMSVADACAKLATPLARRVALLELLAMVLADGVEHPAEHALIKQVMAEMGLASPVLTASADWVRKLHGLYREGAALLDGQLPVAAE